ncbi:hypothetical protein FDECE_8787 [Fusarium decemcellulare]|nr:hypothetical protein FDECE_8787 [Fusarium decemcellulare]
MDSSTGTGRVQKGKAPAKRNTEARREQNRIASRNYREKRKQKLALLNQLLDPSDVSDIANVADNAQIDALQDQSHQTGSDQGLPSDSQSQPASSADAAELLIPTINQDIANVASSLSTFQHDAWGDLPNSTVPASDPAFSQPAFPNSLPLPFVPTNDAFVPSPMNLWAASSFMPSQQLLQYQGDVPMDDIVNPGLVEEIFADSPESADHEGRSNPHTPPDNENDNTFHKVLDGVESLSLSQKRSLLRRLQEETGETRPKSPPPRSSTTKPPRSWLPTRAQMEAVYFTKAIHHAAKSGPTPLPTKYIIEAGLFGAIFANCYALGMGGIEEILYEEGCSVFSVTPDEGHPTSHLPLVRAKFGNVMPDLRPTDSQLTFGHHPYVDVVPFRSFRENIMKALMHDPPLIDEDMLCHDLLAGGFTCWGSGHNPLGMGAAVPWDARSWEPSVWFLLKYRQLTGGWDDEMWKSARWWHSLMGPLGDVGDGK